MKEQPDDGAATGQVGSGKGGNSGFVVRTLALFAWVLGAFFASVAIGAILVGWRLSEGPVRVSFLTPYVQQSMQALPDNWSITIGETYFDWDGEQGTVRIRTADVGFINAASQRVLSLPDAAFTIHGDALFAGRIEPKDVSTSGLSLVLTRSEDNSWLLGTGTLDQDGDRPEAPPGRGIAELASDLFGNPDSAEGSQGVLGRIRQFTLLDSSVSVVDRVNGQIYQIDARRLSMQGTAAGVSVKADTDVSTREFTVPLLGSMIYRPDVQEVAGTVRYGDLSIRRAVEALDGPSVLTGLDFPITGSVGFRVSADTGVAPLRLKLTGGSGQFDLPGILQDPLPVRSIDLVGVLDPEELELKVEDLAYDAGDFQARAKGRFQMTTTGPAVHLEITSNQVPLLRVPAYWPTGKARAVREWLARNVQGGIAREVQANLALTPDIWSLPSPPREAFDVNFVFENGIVRLPATFGQIEDAAGKLHVTGNELAIAISDSRLGGLQLNEGVVTVADFSAEPAVLGASFVSTGTIAETIDAVIRDGISDRNEGFELLLGVGGQAAVRTRITVPLSKTTTLSDADFVASANLSDVVADGLLADVRVRAQELEVKIDRNSAEVTGAAELEQSRFNFQWIENFEPKARVRREFAFNGTLQLEDLKAAGVPAQTNIQGETNLLGLVKFSSDESLSGELEADLAGAAIRIDGLPWEKPPGIAASLKGKFERAQDAPILLTGIKVSAPGLTLQGDIGLSPKGRLLDARLERLDIAGSVLSLVAKQAPDSARWLMQMTGQRMDLRPWRTMLEQSDGEPGPMSDASLDLAVDELVLTDEVMITAAVGDVRLQDPFPTGSLRGLINGKAGVSVIANSDRAGWRFTLTSEDGGSVLAAVGLGSAIQKGRMNVHGVAPDGETMTGLATIDDFTLTETPAFARLISLASFTGIGEALSGRGLSFSRAEVPFTYANRRLDIRKGRMAGPSVGLTTEGYYRFDTDQLRFVGNLIPAYSISQVLGAIPLLGAILGGDQGFFGVTYVVDGPSSAPKVTVNPLSALAPGILRRMFLEPVEEQAIEVPNTDTLQDER
jgi:hypothetical protein